MARTAPSVQRNGVLSLPAESQGHRSESRDDVLGIQSRLKSLTPWWRRVSVFFSRLCRCGRAHECHHAGRRCLMHSHLGQLRTGLLGSGWALSCLDVPHRGHWFYDRLPVTNKGEIERLQDSLMAFSPTAAIFAVTTHAHNSFRACKNNCSPT